MSFKTHNNDDDMMGKKCQYRKCNGEYIETSQHDDTDGVVHCGKCGHAVSRWAPEHMTTAELLGRQYGMKEGYIKKYRRKSLHKKMIRKKTLLRNGTELRSFKDFMAGEDS